MVEREEVICSLSRPITKWTHVTSRFDSCLLLPFPPVQLQHTGTPLISPVDWLFSFSGSPRSYFHIILNLIDWSLKFTNLFFTPFFFSHCRKQKYPGNRCSACCGVGTWLALKGKQKANSYFMTASPTTPAWKYLRGEKLKSWMLPLILRSLWVSRWIKLW